MHCDPDEISFHLTVPLRHLISYVRTNVFRCLYYLIQNTFIKYENDICLCINGHPESFLLFKYYVSELRGVSVCAKNAEQGKLLEIRKLILTKYLNTP